MSSDDYSVIALAETTKSYVKSVKSDERSRYAKKYKKRKTEDEEKDSPLLQRLPSFEPSLTPFRKLCNRFRKLNCLKNSEPEEEVPMMEVPRHKSIDIGVGLARRVSLFLFTRRTVCVHPYHPFTPEQTTRKIHILPDESKHRSSRISKLSVSEH